MKKLRVLWLLPVVLMVAGTFGACCHYEDEEIGLNKPEETYSIVSGWLQDDSDPTLGKVSMAESVYKEDGTFWANIKFISSAEGLNLNVINEGTYTYKNGVLTESYTSSITGGNVKDEYKVVFLDKYTLKTDYMGSVSTLNKIVENHNLQVGDEIAFSYTDAEFSPSSFASNDNKIATVDANGNIKAVKRGTAYITAYSSVGKVVAKVVVEDPDNYVDDFIDDINTTVDEIIEKYGPSYMAINNGDTYHYYFADNLVSGAYFNFGNNAVNSIIVEISQNADFSKIYEMFDNKYEINIEADTYKTYTYASGNLNISLGVDEENRVIYYQLQKKSYEMADEAFYMSIDDAVSKFGGEITAEDDELGMKSIRIRDEFIDRITLTYDASTRKIKGMMIRANSDLSEEEVEEWFEGKYYRTNAMSAAADFCNNEIELSSNIFIKVAYNDSFGCVVVNYMNL